MIISVIYQYKNTGSFGGFEIIMGSLALPQEEQIEASHMFWQVFMIANNGIVVKHDGSKLLGIARKIDHVKGDNSTDGKFRDLNDEDRTMAGEIRLGVITEPLEVYDNDVAIKLRMNPQLKSASKQ